MIRSRVLPAALALIVATAACSDDDNGTGPDPENPIDALVGSYQTQSFKYTADANPELTVDLATLGFGITELTVNADGSFAGTATLEIDGQFQSIPANGTLSNVTETSLTLNFEGIAAVVLPNPLAVTYSVAGNVVSFVADDVNFDYSVVGGPAGELPSTLEVVLLKS